MKILFLHTRLSAYFLACLKYLMNERSYKVLVIHNPSSRFDQGIESNGLLGRDDIRFVQRTGAEMENAVRSFDPDGVVIAGWADREYLHIAKQSKSSGKPVLMSMDNVWKGTFRQQAGVVLKSRAIKHRADKLWIPGKGQLSFARKLGFNEKDILHNLYCADIESFAKYHGPENNYLLRRKSLLFAGRLVPYKNAHLLLEAFNTLNPEERRGWKIEMAGDGPALTALQDQTNENIVFHGFKKPEQLARIMSECSAFCLPSHFEHWGVVVQEAAATGLPLILSDTIGAAHSFLIEGKNGYLFKSNDVGDLKAKLTKFFALSEEERQWMSTESTRLSSRITQSHWLEALEHGIGLRETSSADIG